MMTNEHQITHEELVEKGWTVIAREDDGTPYLYKICGVDRPNFIHCYYGADNTIYHFDAAIGREFTMPELESLVALLTGKEQVCEWKYLVFDSWKISCTGNVEWGKGNPLEDGMTYCPFCGKRIVVKE